MPVISSAAAGIAGDADRRAVAAVSFVFEVVRHRGHWRTLHCAKHSAPFPDQAAAILAAKKLARNKRDLGHAVEVILRRTDGASVVQPVDGDECLSAPA